MNKNHFYIGYAGNKRTECKDIYDSINFNNIETIVEPYCGTCAISYYISLNKPNMKYILNDSNDFLKEMYEILIDDIKKGKFKEEYKKIVSDIDKIKNNLFIICLFFYYIKHYIRVYNIEFNFSSLISSFGIHLTASENL